MRRLSRWLEQNKRREQVSQNDDGREDATGHILTDRELQEILLALVYAERWRK